MKLGSDEAVSERTFLILNTNISTESFTIHKILSSTRVLSSGPNRLIFSVGAIESVGFLLLIVLITSMKNSSSGSNVLFCDESILMSVAR
jgi:hypothetical protein